MEASKGSCDYSRGREEIGSATIHKNLKETHNNGSAPVTDGNQTKQLPVSTHSQQKSLAHKLKATKRYLKSLFSKASNTRVPNHHLSQINLSIQRESYEGDDVATATRSSHIEKSDATHRKSFSESFFFIKGAPWKPKLNSNNASGNHSGAQLGRRMISANPGMENDIEAAIAHCKQSLSADPKNMIDTCAEIYADSHVHCHSQSSSSNHIPLGKTVGSYSSTETRFG